MNRAILLVVSVLPAVACTSSVPKPGSDLADPPYTFPHRAHADAGLPCTACHAGIEQAADLGSTVRHVKLPRAAREEACRGCHETEPAPRVPSRAAPSRLTFSHAAHVGRVADCRSCHRALPEPGDGAAAAPPMETCTSCHRHQLDFAQARCTPCHVDLKGREPSATFRHAGDWLRLHGDQARPSASTCAQCHDEAYCASCHAAQTAPALPATLFPERVERSFIHRGDYVSRHAVDAGANPASCRRCHGSASCEACHRQQGVSALASNATDRHPAGWSTGHGRAARRDATRCASCHEGGASSLCVDCHRVGGRGGNPHPTSFLSRHDLSEVTRNGMCRSCHAG